MGDRLEAIGVTGVSLWGGPGDSLSRRQPWVPSTCWRRALGSSAGGRGTDQDQGRPSTAHVNLVPEGTLCLVIRKYSTPPRPHCSPHCSHPLPPSYTLPW